MLELLILAACRSDKLRQMQWDEINFSSAAIWTIPAARMKDKVLHRMPLGPRAIGILEKRREKSATGEGLAFPSRSCKPMTDMALSKFLRDKEIENALGHPVTSHGFRFSFGNQAFESSYPRDPAERALAHMIKNAVEAAYQRPDLAKRRLAMMLEWGGIA